MSELWKDVSGYEGIYAVSELGRVRSLPRVDCVGRRLSGRVLKQKIAPDGALRVNLSCKGRQKTVKTHQLVAEAFLAKPHNAIIRHIDGNLKNNRLSNLEYCSWSRLHQLKAGVGAELFFGGAWMREQKTGTLIT